MIPHQPPANTLVIQKLAAILPNSVIMRTITQMSCIMPRNITKHLGHTFTKLSLSGDAMFQYE